MVCTYWIYFLLALVRPGLAEATNAVPKKGTAYYLFVLTLTFLLTYYKAATVKPLE